MPDFSLGAITVTPAAAAALASAGLDPASFLARHQAGDWGKVTAAERQANEQARQHGQLIVSLYSLGDGPLLRVVTAADRSQTQLGLANEELVYELSTQAGYEIWSHFYDHEDNALIVLEEQVTGPLLPTLSSAHVLDLGTGTGRYALRLARQGARVTAVDQSPAMLAVARQAAQQAALTIDFQEQSLENELPYEAGRFDLVISALALCHVADLARAIREAYRVLQPGGHLLITDFHPAVIAEGWRTQFSRAGVTYLLPTAHHTREAYLDALRQAGFTVLKVHDLRVRDVPEGYFPPSLVERYGGVPFCFIILATKLTPFTN
jgi:ubiquinone/menaquinone biosynthesis C-methylase UbiE